jgi:hypothetical protein
LPLDKKMKSLLFSLRLIVISGSDAVFLKKAVCRGLPETLHKILTGLYQNPYLSYPKSLLDYIKTLTWFIQNPYLILAKSLLGF